MNLENMLKSTFKENDIRNYFYANKFLIKKDELNTIEEKNNYETIIKLMAMNEDYKNLNNAFENKITHKNELDNEDEELLKKIKQLDIEKFPLIVSTRIYDVLWSKFHDLSCGNNAVKKYLELFEIVYDSIHWTWCLNVIYRATVIAAQIGKDNPLFNDCINKIVEKLNLMDGNDENFLSIELVELLEVQKHNDKCMLLNILDKIIAKAKLDNKMHKVETAYTLKLKIEKDPNKKKIIKLEMAEYYEIEADKKEENDSRNIFNKIDYLQSAVHNYNESGEKEKSNRVMKKLEDSQKNINKCMTKIKSETIDCTEMVLDIKKDMEDLNFEEAIIRLVQYTKFHKKDEIKKRVLKKYKNFIGMSLFGQKIVDKEGKTLIELPGLDFNNPEKDEKVFELYMFREALSAQEIEGFILSIILNEIINKYNFEKEDIRFLVCDNVIIPDGRENIILNGIYLGLKGDYYSSLHILAPQIENLFRNIAKEAGGITFTLENDNTSKVKVLSSVFEIEELKECYNEDILFLFKGLLNEQAGANIRNDIGHGIIDEEKANSSLGVYFLCAVIKLCCLTSKEATNILKNSKKLNKK